METSYGLPGEGQPRESWLTSVRLPTWSQTAYRRCTSDEERKTRRPSEMDRAGIQRLAEQPNAEKMYATLPESSPLIGDGRLERAGLTVAIAHPDPTGPATAELADNGDLEYAVEITYEGIYDLAEETLADGTSSLLDEHFGALGGWSLRPSVPPRRSPLRLSSRPGRRHRLKPRNRR